MPGSTLPAATWLALAERVCSRSLCRPSTARGVGGLGIRAKRCAQRRVLHVDPLGLCALRAQRWAFSLPLSDSCSSFRLGPNVQADTGDTALCSVAAGLLAPRQSSAVFLQRSRGNSESVEEEEYIVVAGDRKGSIICALSRVLRSDASGAETSFGFEH